MLSLNVFEFMDQILRLLPRCFERPYSSDDFDYEEYFDLLRVFCQFGPNALSHLLNRRCVEKFIATFRGGFSITKMTDDEDSYDFDEISDMYKKKEYPWMKHVLRVLSVLITSSEDKVKMEVKAKRVSSEVQLDIAGSGCDGENDDYLGIADSHWELSPELLHELTKGELVQFLVLNTNVNEEQAAYHILAHLVHHESDEIFELVLDVLLPRAVRNLRQHHENLLHVLLAVDPNISAIHGNPGPEKKAALFRMLIQNLSRLSLNTYKEENGKKAEKFSSWLCNLVSENKVFQHVLFEELRGESNWFLLWMGPHVLGREHEPTLSETAVKIFSSLLRSIGSDEPFWTATDGILCQLRDYILTSFECDDIPHLPSANMFRALSLLVDCTKNVDLILVEWSKYQNAIQQVTMKFSEGILPVSYIIEVLNSLNRILQQLRWSETNLQMRKTEEGRKHLKVNLQRIADILCKCKWYGSSGDESWITLITVLLETCTTIMKSIRPADVDNCGFDSDSFLLLMQAVLSKDFSGGIGSDADQQNQNIKTSGHIYQFLPMLIGKSPSGAIKLRQQLIRMILKHMKPGAYAFYVLRQCLTDDQAFEEFEKQGGIRILLTSPKSQFYMSLKTSAIKKPHILAAVIEVVSEYCNWLKTKRKYTNPFSEAPILDIFILFYAQNVFPMRQKLSGAKGRPQVIIHKACTNIMEFLEKTHHEGLQAAIRRAISMDSRTATLENDRSDESGDAEFQDTEELEDKVDPFLQFDSSLYDRFQSFDNMTLQESIQMIFEALESKKITGPIWNYQLERSILRSIERDIENCDWILKSFTINKLLLIFTCDIPALRAFLLDCIRTAMVRMKQHVSQDYVATEPNPESSNAERPDPPSKRRKVNRDLTVLKNFAGKLIACLNNIFLLEDSCPHDLLLLIQHFAFLDKEAMEYIARSGFQTLYDIFTTSFTHPERNSKELQKKIYESLKENDRLHSYMEMVLMLMSSIIVSVSFGDQWKGTNEHKPKEINAEDFVNRFRAYDRLVPFGLDNKVELLKEMWDLVQSDNFRKASNDHKKWGTGMYSIYSYIFQNSFKETTQEFGHWIQLFAGQNRPDRPYRSFLDIILGCHSAHSKRFGIPGREERKIMWTLVLEQVANLENQVHKQFPNWLKTHIAEQTDLQNTIMSKLENPEHDDWVLKMFLHKLRNCRNLMKHCVTTLLETHNSQKDVWTKLLSFLLNFILNCDNTHIPAQIFNCISKIADKFQMRKPIVRLLPKLQEIFCSGVEKNQASDLDELDIISRLLSSILKYEALEGLDVPRMIKAIVNYKPMLEYSMQDGLDSFFKLLFPLVKLLDPDKFEELDLHESPFFQLMTNAEKPMEKYVRESTQNVVKDIVLIIFQRWTGTEESRHFRHEILDQIHNNYLKATMSTERGKSQSYWPYFLLLQCSSDESILQKMHVDRTIPKAMKHCIPRLTPETGLSYLLKLIIRFVDWIQNDDAKLLRFVERVKSIFGYRDGRTGLASIIINSFLKFANTLKWKEYAHEKEIGEPVPKIYWELFQSLKRMGCPIFKQFVSKFVVAFDIDDKEENIHQKEKRFFFHHPYMFEILLRLAETDFETEMGVTANDFFVCILWAAVFKKQKHLKNLLPPPVWNSFEHFYRCMLEYRGWDSNAVHNIWNYRFLGYQSSASVYEHMQLHEIPEEILQVFDLILFEMTKDHDDYFPKVVEWILSQGTSQPGNAMDRFLSLSTLCAMNEAKIRKYLQENQAESWDRLVDLLKTVEGQLEHYSESLKDRFDKIKDQCSDVAALQAIFPKDKE